MKYAKSVGCFVAGMSASILMARYLDSQTHNSMMAVVVLVWGQIITVVCVGLGIIAASIVTRGGK